MRLLTAGLEGFRNLAEAALEFSPTVNLFHGANGQGKTNLIEALCFPALGRSHRGARDEELIGFDQPRAQVSLVAADEEGRPLRLGYALERGGGRRMVLDGQPVARRVDLVGRLLVVVFDPPAVALASGAPELRRRFADQGLCAVSRAYLEDLQGYVRALRQKGQLLREMRRGGGWAGAGASTWRELAAWNRELARRAAPLCESRSAYARALAPAAAAAYGAIGGGTSSLEIGYKPGLEACRGGGFGKDLQAEILAEFDYIGEVEARRGRPLAGPHLDDFEILLAGVSLRKYGSQGELRSAAIALKLAQAEVIHSQKNVRPVLFFDDIFSELDPERARRLQQMCSAEHQLLIATARRDDVSGWRPEGLKVWRVRAGRIEAMA